MEEVKPELIKKTQVSLAKYIKEPTLTDKLLRKPPFRFILDIVKSVIKETQFLKDVFTQEELLESSKDKEKKLIFLKKLIVAVQNATQKTIAAKPGKIAAGLEVNKTLELLIELAKGIESRDKTNKAKDTQEKKNRESSVEIKKVKQKKDEKIETKKESKKSKDDKPKRKSSIEEKKIEKNMKTELINHESEETKENPEIMPENNLQTENLELQVLNNHEKTELEPKAKAENEINQKTIEEPKIEEKKVETKPERRPSTRKSSSRRPSKQIEKIEKIAKQPEKPKTPEPPVLGTETSPKVVERPKTARKAPPSARTGAPKMRDRGEVKQDLNDNQVETKPVPLIMDVDLTDDKENIVKLETQPFETEKDTLIDFNEKFGENEGALVAQILETNKELDESKQLWGQNHQEWEGGKKKKREAWLNEINKVRDGIQQLTRSTNPLGKLFDFLQEDVDAMLREIKVWSDSITHYTKQIDNEKKKAEISLESYKKQLAELDNSIEQEIEAVRNVKANILANDKRLKSITTRISD